MTTMVSIVKASALLLIIMSALVIAIPMHVLALNQKPQIIITMQYAPSAIWNPYLAGNSFSLIGTWAPLALYNPYVNQFWPVLASNWTIQVFPNGSGVLTVYLRHDVYWFNGSAVMPFTAWDVYTYFYIGVKAFKWYYPYIQPQYADEDIRVINNHEIQFLFQIWSSPTLISILTSQIATPYEVWRPIVNGLRVAGPNQTKAYYYELLKIVNMPHWALSPYYMVAFNSSFLEIALEPEYFTGPEVLPNGSVVNVTVPLLATWDRVFPLHSWQYYSPILMELFVSNSGQAIYDLTTHRATLGSIAGSAGLIGRLNNSGIGVYLWPQYSAWGIVIEPNTYPWNIPQVREALCMLINRTMAIYSWGLGYPDYYPEPAPPYIVNTFPPSIRSLYVPCMYNLSEAVRLLRSVGLTYKNSTWYLPNGTPLTITITGPYAYTDWMTMLNVVAMELQRLGIGVRIVSQEVLGVYWGLIVHSGHYEAALVPLTFMQSYYTSWQLTESMSLDLTAFNFNRAWPFRWPNGTCSPVIMPRVHNSPYTTVAVPNATIVWCVNSTYGYINLTNWLSAFKLAQPGTSDYNILLATIFAWYHYFIPIVPIAAELQLFEYDKGVIDPLWLHQPYIVSHYPWLTALSTPLYTVWGSFPMDGNSPLPLVALGLVTPPGTMPPVAQAIINGSMWTNPTLSRYAAFLGIPSPDPILQQTVTAYFKTTYTPVHVSTTEATSTTSTVITTATAVTKTAAVVTSAAKPAMGMALIAGSVVVVVVAAALGVVILRRR